MVAGCHCGACWSLMLTLVLGQARKVGVEPWVDWGLWLQREFGTQMGEAAVVQTVVMVMLLLLLLLPQTWTASGRALSLEVELEVEGQQTRLFWALLSPMVLLPSTLLLLGPHLEQPCEAEQEQVLVLVLVLVQVQEQVLVQVQVLV